MHNVIFENGGGEIFVSINTLLPINVALESGLESQRKDQVPLGRVGVLTWVPERLLI